MKRFFTKRDSSGGAVGLLTVTGELSAVHIRPHGGFNNQVELGVLHESRFRRFINSVKEFGVPLPFGMLVTTVGVGYMVDDWDAGTLNISDLNFHDSGVGTVAAATGDTALGTASGPATRATGTKSQPLANVIKSVGTINYTSTLAITEWGLFSTASRGTTLLWDRKVFSAVNVGTGDSIQFSYELTITAGG